RGDDRRNLAARAGASHRRRKGEGAGGGARRHHHGAAARAQPKGPGGCAGGGAGAGAFRLARARRRRGCRGLESTRDARGGGSARRRPNIGPARGAVGVTLNETLALVRTSIACAASRLFAPPHCVVGLLIENNGPETMAHRFRQPPVSIAMLACTGAVAGAGRHRMAAFSSLLRRSSKAFVASAPT